MEGKIILAYFAGIGTCVLLYIGCTVLSLIFGIGLTALGAASSR